MSLLTLRNGAFVPGITQNILTSGTSQPSNAVSDDTSIIRVTCQKDTYVALGATPVVTTGSMLLVGGTTEFLAVEPGTTKVAVMQVSNSGLVSITELTGY